MFDVSWAELLVVITLGWLLTDPKDYIYVIKSIGKVFRKIDAIRNEVQTVLVEISKDAADESERSMDIEQESLRSKEQYIQKLSTMYFEAKYTKEDDNTTIH